MGFIRLLRPGLFICECVKILILAGFVSLQPLLASALTTPDLAIFPLVVFTAPSVLFPLMAMFLWIDISRYATYIPLFLAGKCLSIVSLLGWSIIVRHHTITNVFSGLALTESLLVCGDLLTIAIVILMLNGIKKQKIKAEVE